MSRGASAMRHRSREVALQVLYAAELADRPAGPRGEGAAQAFERVAQHFELPEGARAFAKALVTGVVAEREALDALLARHLRGWRMERLAAVDRNLLRLGAWELTHGDAPAEVVIDEAVSLAHRFAGERAPALVNGVLDAVVRERAAGERT